MARSTFRKIIQTSKDQEHWKSDKKKRDMCLNFDAYGKPVSLTFHGSDNFKTRVGAIITIMAVVFVIGFGAFRLISYKSNKIIQITMHEDNLI